jgi:hypothetical protein
VVWVSEIIRLFLLNYVCGFFTDAVVLFSRNDVTLGPWMLSFRSLLTFCDNTYWPLVIDVYTHYLIHINKITNRVVFDYILLILYNFIGRNVPERDTYSYLKSLLRDVTKSPCLSYSSIFTGTTWKGKLSLMWNKTNKCKYRCASLFYYKQRSLLHVSAIYCDHLQGRVLWRI